MNILLIFMQFQQTKNSSFNPKFRVRLKQIPTKDKASKFGNVSRSINLDFDQYFSPWGNQDGKKLLNSYPLYKQQKAHSALYSTFTHDQFSLGQEKRARYRQRSLLQRKNNVNIDKILKMSSLDMHLDEETIYSPQKKYGMTDLTSNNARTRENHRQMPNRVKILKNALLKFEKSEEQNDRARQKQIFSTYLTQKFSTDLVADTLTISSVNGNNSYRTVKNTRRVINSEQNKALPRLKVEQKSVKQQTGTIQSAYKKRMSFEERDKKQQWKMKQFIMRQDEDEDGENKLIVGFKEHSSKVIDN